MSPTSFIADLYSSLTVGEVHADAPPAAPEPMQEEQPTKQGEQSTRQEEQPTKQEEQPTKQEEPKEEEEEAKEEPAEKKEEAEEEEPEDIMPAILEGMFPLSVSMSVHYRHGTITLWESTARVSDPSKH